MTLTTTDPGTISAPGRGISCPEKRRTAKAGKAEIPANTNETVRRAMEQAEGLPVQDAAETATNGAEVQAEGNGPESIITAEDSEEAAESTAQEEAPQEYALALRYM